MPPAQRDLAIRSIRIGLQVLEITVNSPAYREGMKYGMHYVDSSGLSAHIRRQPCTIPMQLLPSPLRSYCAWRDSCKYQSHLIYNDPLTSCSPDQCNMDDVRHMVERLSMLLSEGSS